ncbi:MAG: hypothetical protein M1833_004128 [Piccolia ochrophora]|nr:MAG: hypothetical protein M1833_004128 [Piccolia ochrophora]
MSALFVISALMASALAAPGACPAQNGATGGSPALPAKATAEAVTLPPNTFGPMIEAAAVNSKGDVFAGNFTGDKKITDFTYAIAFKADSKDSAAFVADAKNNPVFKALQSDGLEKAPLINGARFVRGDKLLIADSTNHRVISVKAVNAGTQATEASVVCADQKMLSPNDIAISTLRDTLIYLSGQNFTEDTVAGKSGDLWTCDGGGATQFSPEILAAADIHRTNGIETSPDGTTLYLSAAANKGGAVVSNKIFKFALNKDTGAINQEAPKLFFDFADPEEAKVDIDGMRTDIDGNLWVTRNGAGKAVLFDKDGKLLQTVVMPGMGGPSNLELGGPEGKDLIAVGKCKDDEKSGCIARFKTQRAGKAFNSLQQV